MRLGRARGPRGNLRTNRFPCVSSPGKSVADTIDPILDEVDIWGQVAWLQQVVGDTLYEVDRTVYSVLCGTFGAC